MISNKNLAGADKKEKETFKKKNVLFGVKFKFLGRNPQGNLISTENAKNRASFMIFEAFYKRGIDITNVFLKEETLDFFIATDKDIISLNSLDKDWVREYKHNWGKVFFNLTTGQYTLYPELYKDITDEIEELVKGFDNGKPTPDFWYKSTTSINNKTECMDCGHITHGNSKWKFMHLDKTYMEEVKLSEDGTWDLQPIIEQFGESFEASIMDGEEACPECGSIAIYPYIAHPFEE